MFISSFKERKGRSRSKVFLSNAFCFVFYFLFSLLFYFIFDLFLLQLNITSTNILYCTVPGLGRQKVIKHPPRTAFTIFRNIRSFLYRDKVYRKLRLKRALTSVKKVAIMVRYSYRGKSVSFVMFCFDREKLHFSTPQHQRRPVRVKLLDATFSQGRRNDIGAREANKRIRAPTAIGEQI